MDVQDNLVSKWPTCAFANRPLSQLQRAILEYLATKLPDRVDHGHYGYGIGHLPRTGEIIDALGRRRDKCGFAAVSRSLTRLLAAELILAWRSPFATRGDGCHYSLNDPAVAAAIIATRDRWTATPQSEGAEGS